MIQYLAILRGINVSGKNKIKMEDLRTLLRSLDFQEVQTYIQSGNIVFATAKMSTTTLAEKIHQLILKKYGYDVPVLVKTKAELKAVATQNPFLNDRSEDIKFLHVTFLAENPETEKWELIDNEKYKPDEFQVSERALYVFCPNGYGRTKLNNNFFEKKLKTTATTRNWKTVMKLAEMLDV